VLQAIQRVDLGAPILHGPAGHDKREFISD
jgi:hypothetical protein